MAQNEDSQSSPPTGKRRKPATESNIPFVANPLGIYFIVVALGLAFVVYVLWPDITTKDGVPVWADTVRVFAITLGSEPRLILLVLTAGALGSYVHAATSFVTYVGNRTLRASWTWWYLLRPFIGMALALIFYFVIRGGLLSAGAQASEVSPFGITAVAGLVGMFSKQATDKLQEVFDNLFRTQAGEGDAQRRDKAMGTMTAMERMIPLNKITACGLAKGQTAADIKVLDLYGRYGGVVTRLPVLDHGSRVLHVIHQSLVYKFISEKSVAGAKAVSGQPPFDLAALTLADLLAEPGMDELVTKAIAFVARNATLGEAKAAMEQVPRCQDVFVTEHGISDEPIKGWLTNVDIGRLAEG